MSLRILGGNSGKRFGKRELAEAAGLVRVAMLETLPEPEDCEWAPSPEFQRKIKKLFAKERIINTVHTVRRWVAAILLMLLVGACTVVAVDTEARASFFDWMRKVYEKSIIYEFFNEPQVKGLPVYELGWVPEGYEAVDVYQDEDSYSAIYVKGDDSSSGFVFDYSFGHSGTVVAVMGDMSKYEHKHFDIDRMDVDFYRSLDGTETNSMICIDEESGIVFMLNGFLEESVMLHICENIILVEMTK